MSIPKVILPDSVLIADLLTTLANWQSLAIAQAFSVKETEQPCRGWKLLADIFNLQLSPSKPEPFGPLCQWEGKRSMIPDDLSDGELDALHETLNKIYDPAYQARVGDVIWLRRKDVTAAQIAVAAYVNLGNQFEVQKNWHESAAAFERGLRLAKQIDSKGNLPKSVLEHLESRIFHYNGLEAASFCLDLLELLGEFKFGNFLKLSDIAGIFANKASSAGKYDEARNCFNIQAKLLKLAKDNVASEAALVSAAQTLVEEAHACEAQGRYIAARHFWELALFAFRERSSLKQLVPGIQQSMNNAGKLSVGEMQTVHVEMDFSELIEQTIKDFESLDLKQALCKLALCMPLIDPAKLKNQVLADAQEPAIYTLFKTEFQDSDGRKLGSRPGLLSSDPLEQESTIEGLMEESAQKMRGFAVHARIVPAMKVILNKISSVESNIENLIADSCFVPKGRLPLFVQAIAAGFKFDFVTALHILVPQSENGLRQLVKQLGDQPITVKSDGIEDFWTLDRILNNPKLQSHLGARWIYELRSLLDTKTGPNFRNAIAHGFVSPQTLKSEEANYTWWLLFRLVICHSSLLQEYPTQNNSTAS